MMRFDLAFSLVVGVVLIEELRELKTGNTEFDTKFHTLMENVQHHVERIRDVSTSGGGAGGTPGGANG